MRRMWETTFQAEETAFWEPSWGGGVEWRNLKDNVAWRGEWPKTWTKESPFLCYSNPVFIFCFLLSFPTLYSREIKCTFTCLMIKLWFSCIFGWPFWDSPDYTWHTFSLLGCHVSFRFILLTRKPLYCSSKKSLKEDRPPFLPPISQKSRVKKTPLNR